MIGGIFNSVINTVDDFIDDPVGTVTNMAVQPAQDVISVLDGLTEGELRHKAALRLGADVVASMALAEVIDYLAGEE